ncbi:M15 family metallopeptidase [Rickettsiaceae bacterium]|nr:M15 family metallopeptidase [Rickettsiaceae bacterium]
MKFTISPIPEKIAKDMQEKAIWAPDCPVSLEQLCLLDVSHYNFDGKILEGQIIVLDKIAKKVLSIFEELLILKFPIQSLKLMNEFNGNDEMAMDANNSSGFNFRAIAGTDKLSMHSYGLAIDINPLQNPYIIIDENTNKIEVFPEKGAKFLNRGNLRKGMVEPIVAIFKKHGINIWGGNWNSPIDYHHFQVERDVVARNE